METELGLNPNIPVNNQTVLSDNLSVCKTPEDNQRLLKLFEIFIKIDQNLMEKQNEQPNNQ